MGRVATYGPPDISTRCTGSTPHMTKAPVEQVPVPEGYTLQKAKKPIFKRVWFWLLIAVVVIAIVATQADGGSTSSSGGGSSTQGSADAKPAGIGTAVRDGKFEFTVLGIDCSQNTLGT